MSTDEKIVQKMIQALEVLQEGQKALQTDVTSIKDGQHKQGEQLEKQGKHIEALHTDVKTLNSKVDTVDLKVETIHEYQKKAHDEIMNILFESNEISGHDQKELEQRIARIEKHLGLPPLGARFSWGRAGIATKMRYAFGTPNQGFQRRPMPDAMPTRQHTRR